jgi:DNA mismatch repair protein MutH
MGTVHGEHPASSFTGLVGHESGFFDSPVSGAYTLIQSAAYAFDIKSITAETASGTVSGTLLIDSTPITGISGVTWNTSEATSTASGANSVPVGGKVEISFSFANAFGLAWTYKIVRT